MFSLLLQVYQHNNPNFSYRQVVGGGHHLHLNTPELVSPLVNEFLLKQFAASGPDAPGGSDHSPPFDLL